MADPTPGRPGDVLVIETTIDDMNPQNYGHFLDRALAAGALEVFFTPVMMKKGRPGMLVTAIVAPGDFDAVARLIFRETTTIGFRWRRESRRELDRRFTAVSTPWGRVRVKVSSDAGEVMHAQPEYEDCRRLALERDVPLKDVQRAALAAVNADLRLSSGTGDKTHSARPAPSRASGARRGPAAARRKRT